MQSFDIDAWVEARKARWAEIVAMGDQSAVRDPQEIMGMTDEEYDRWINQGNGSEE